MNDPTTATSGDPCGSAASGSKPVGNDHVLGEEYCWLWPGETAPTDYHASVWEKKQAALCLSGGGIRSAAFALGVLQALSRKQLLTGFHYLSTVSGGGYIGSFVQRWIKEAPGGAAEVMAGLGDVTERVEIKRLRENSNFLTPRIGLGSNDTWTAVAISLRNIIVNWFLFFPLLLLVALLPNLFLSGVVSVPKALPSAPWFDDILLACAGLSIATSVAFTVPLLSSYRSGYSVKPGEGDGWLFWRVILPILAWATSGTLALAPELLELHAKAAAGVMGDWPAGTRLALVTFAAMLGGLAIAAFRIERGYFRTFRGDLVVWPLSFAVVAVWVWLGAVMFNRLVPDDGTQWPGALLTTIGPLWLTTGTLLAAIAFTAFRHGKGPTIKPDADRELIARISAIKFKPMLAWALAGFSALLLSSLVRGAGDLSISSAVTAVAGVGAIAGGKSERSGNLTQPSGPSSLLRFLPMSLIVSLATLLFIIGLFVFLGALEARLAGLIEKPLRGYVGQNPGLGWIDPTVVAHSAIALVLIGLVWFFARTIQVNRFSLNALYRNRLARAFLGAARPSRLPNPFTGFDSADNVRMHQLRDDDLNKPRVLYPIVNVTLNVTATENLAWQERKAEPFIFSPLYSGSGMLDPVGTKPGTHAGAYVSSAVYGGNEPDLALGGTSASGITLATAVSISGAAASPNMGYNSSPATAFLMTLFNVRLGAWLPNPALAEKLGPAIGLSSPDNSLRPLINELSGTTDDRGKDIYLSDGGHFENLAVYEMLRRRCRYIVVSDAGADPECAFSDLGGAVRKAKIDFDIDVDFGKLCISSRNHDIHPQLAWAVGTVTYPGGDKGAILYIKPSFWGRELPVDIVSYAKASLTFPHESTGDQWFSESQFESYRHLGFYFADNIAPGLKKPTIEAFFRRAAADYRVRTRTGTAATEEDSPDTPVPPAAAAPAPANGA